MTDRPLPETIPAGTYMLVPGDKRTTGLQITKRTPMHRSGWFVNATGCDLTEAQARHLIAMPGRPHDDRLDGATEPTGAERYLARRLEDAEYRRAYEEARADRAVPVEREP